MAGINEVREEIRKKATASYNEAFNLIESGADPVKAVHLAGESLALWRQVGNEQNMAIGYWLQSRAFAAASEGLRAIEAAEKSLQHLSEIASPADWLIASLNEGLARAYMAASDARAHEAIKKTSELVANILDDEDREIIAEQFASLKSTGSV